MTSDLHGGTRHDTVTDVASTPAAPVPIHRPAEGGEVLTLQPAVQFRWRKPQLRLLIAIGACFLLLAAATWS